MDYLKLLNEFETVISEKVNRVRYNKFIPNDKISQLRARLIDEECQELLQELYEGDEVAALKEACDVLYVVFGTAAVYNWDIDEAFRRVHANNMLKIGYPIVNGKLQKAKDHPKVILTDLVPKQLELPL